MLRSKRALSLMAVVTTLISCKSIDVEMSSGMYIGIGRIFSDPFLVDGKNICSSGFVMVDENIAVYPSVEFARNYRYDKAVLLRGVDRDKLENEMSDFDKLSFCGIVDLQKECWTNGGEEAACAPFSKPIHLRVTKVGRSSR